MAAKPTFFSYGLKPIAKKGSIIFCLLAHCASGKFNVPDEKFFADGYEIEKNYIQYVEVGDNTGISEPAAERFRKNCAEAENKAKARFVAAYPQSKDEGRRIGEYFEKNGACRIRIAFKTS